MDFLKNIFTIKRKWSTKANMSPNKHNKSTSTITCDNNNHEMTPNLHTKVMNESSNSQICLNLHNADKVIDPTDCDTFEDRVEENDKISTVCEDIPINEINNGINEPKCNSTCEGDINTIYMGSLKESSEIDNVFNKNSLVPEFDELLGTLRKADSTPNLSKENISLNFVDVFFGKLNADLNTCDINNTDENSNEKQDTKLLLKTHKLALTNTGQKILENAKINDKAHTIDRVNIDDSIELVYRIDLKRGITENKCIETKEIDTSVRESENRPNLLNFQDVFKEFIGQTSKKDSVEIEYSFKELQTQGNYTNNDIDKDGIVKEDTTDKYEKLSKTGRNLNSNKNPELIDDENYSTKLNKKYTEAKMDTISISSTEDNDVHIDKLNDSYCSGYHSSDFEFITENEAELGGIITNTISKEPSTLKTVQMTKGVSLKRECGGQSGSAPSVENSDASSSTSHVRNEDIYTRRNGIPQGDDYLNLFRGVYDSALPLSHIYFLENKSVQMTGMNLEFEGIGFDMRMMHRSKSESTDDEFKPEAIETRRKIISKYSRLNRKRSHPFRNKQK